MAARIGGSMSQATEDLLTCSVCLEWFVNPKSLRCLHTFCALCLDKLHNKQQNLITCPLCKSDTRLPVNGVHGLPKDFKIAQLKDLLEKGQGVNPSTGDYCDVCKAKEMKLADFRCDKCSVFYCSECVKKHNSNPVLRSHSVTNLAVAETLKSKLMCAKHSTHPVAFVCFTCTPHCMICAICILDHEKGHNQLDLQQADGKIRILLKNGLGKVKAGGMLIREYLATADKMKDYYDEALGKAQEGISQQAEVLVAEVRKQETQMLKEAQDKVEDIISKYNLPGASSQLSSIESVKKELEQVLSKGSSEACIASHQKLTEQVEKMKQFAIPKDTPQINVQFIPSDVTSSQFSLGTIRDSKTIKESKPKIQVKKTVINAYQCQIDSGDVSSICEGCKREKSPLVGMYCLQKRCLERLCTGCRRMHDIIGHKSEPAATPSTNV